MVTEPAAARTVITRPRAPGRGRRRHRRTDPGDEAALNLNAAAPVNHGDGDQEFRREPWCANQIRFSRSG